MEEKKQIDYIKFESDVKFPLTANKKLTQIDKEAFERKFLRQTIHSNEFHL